METISKEELRTKIERGDPFDLVEVLPPKAFDRGHLPRAMNIPLDDYFESAVRKVIPDKDREVVVYCQNDECQASPKAARRLEKMGYRRVRDFEGGKDEWRASN